MTYKRFALLIALMLTFSVESAQYKPIVIGSKSFPESHLLAELVAQLLEDHGYPVERRTGLGGTLIAHSALVSGAIAVYPEYTGTIRQTIIKQPLASPKQLQQQLMADNLYITESLGFTNSYALVVTAQLADSLSLQTIEDLARYPQLRASVSLEFLQRADGWPALKSHYQLPQEVTGIEHALAYDALLTGKADLTDAYTSDGKLLTLPLVALEDNRQFFSDYEAVYFYSNRLPAEAQSIIKQLENRLDQKTIQALNLQHSQSAADLPAIVSQWLTEQQLVKTTRSTSVSAIKSIWRYTKEHLLLSGSALLLAIILALPFAVSIARQPSLANGAIYLAGLIQTIPSLALLALFIPWLGLGWLPAVVALLLYSILPILRNTVVAMTTIDQNLIRVARAMGLTKWQRLINIELPLAAPGILAGIKTAAIINLGTATLAAFVGAGGLGQPIITGLTLNNTTMILQGAIPVAALAIVTEWLFQWLEKRLLPSHLTVRTT